MIAVGEAGGPVEASALAVNCLRGLEDLVERELQGALLQLEAGPARRSVEKALRDLTGRGVARVDFCR